jgi:hypothetical protein
MTFENKVDEKDDGLAGAARFEVFTKEILAHPACPWCEMTMRLAHIEPDKRDHDRRTFECPSCENILIETVRYR